jgi:hypothetical protein
LDLLKQHMNYTTKNKNLPLALFVGCILVISCVKKVPKETPPTQVNSTQDLLDTIYNGGGNEPGWRVLLIKNKAGTLTYDLLLDYGERQLKGNANKLPSPGKNMATHYVLNDATKPMVLSITLDPCVDDGDIAYETSVSLSDQKFILYGCGRFITSQ